MFATGSTLNFFKKNWQCVIWLVQILATMVAKKPGLEFFTWKLIFQLILTQNIIEIVINLSMASKNPNSKNKNILNQPEFEFVFFMNFKGKKTLNINSPLQIEPFDTNIIRFCDLNRFQRFFFLFIIKIQRLFSLVSQTRNTKKNNFFTKIELEKYWGNKSVYIFCETYGIPPVFDALFTSVPFFSILSFHNKSKSIGLQLGLSREKKFDDQIRKI